MIKEYYELVKPGIVYGNAFTTLAAFLFASRWHFSAALFLATMLGITLVIASACVFNNYIDRELDSKMTRTRDRALASGKIPNSSALVYASALGVIGFALLSMFVNALTATVAFTGFVFYVIIYGWAKRTGSWGTLVGSIAGAAPIVVGYTAVTNRFDLAALLLFLILALWQMPHFYAIALHRLEEYKAAGIPVLPIAKGARRTKVSILLYIVAFIIAAASLTFFNFTAYGYLAVILSSGLVWLWLAARGFTASDDAMWARRLFLFSLIVLVAFCGALAFAPLVP